MPWCPVENAVSGTVPKVYELLLAHDLSSPAKRRSTSITCWSRRTAPSATAVRARDVAPDRAGAVRRLFPRAIAASKRCPCSTRRGRCGWSSRPNDGRTAAIASRRAAALYGADDPRRAHPGPPRELDAVPAALAARRTHADRRAAEGARRLRPAPRARAPWSRAAAPGRSRPEHHQDRRAADRRHTPFEYRFVVEMVGARGRHDSCDRRSRSSSGDDVAQGSRRVSLIGSQQF